MNILAWLLALTMLTILMIQAVVFHKATVCRQDAWLKGVELSTSALFDRPKEHDQRFIAGCQVHVIRSGKKISWRSLSNLKSHEFRLPLRGSL